MLKNALFIVCFFLSVCQRIDVTFKSSLNQKHQKFVSLPTDNQIDKDKASPKNQNFHKKRLKSNVRLQKQFPFIHFKQKLTSKKIKEQLPQNKKEQIQKQSKVAQKIVLAQKKKMHQNTQFKKQKITNKRFKNQTKNENISKNVPKIIFTNLEKSQKSQIQYTIYLRENLKRLKNASKIYSQWISTCIIILKKVQGLELRIQETIGSANIGINKLQHIFKSYYYQLRDLQRQFSEDSFREEKLLSSNIQKEQFGQDYSYVLQKIVQSMHICSNIEQQIAHQKLVHEVTTATNKQKAMLSIKYLTPLLSLLHSASHITSVYIFQILVQYIEIQLLIILDDYQQHQTHHFVEASLQQKQSLYFQQSTQIKLRVIQTSLHFLTPFQSRLSQQERKRILPALQASKDVLQKLKNPNSILKKTAKKSLSFKIEH